MTERENLIRTYRFGGPERIPIKASIQGNCWAYYGRERVLSHHPMLFPDFESGRPYRATIAPWRRKGTYVDSWGCVWQVPEDGITGAVKEPPLADWRTFDGFIPPDPATDDGWGRAPWSSYHNRAQRRRDWEARGEEDPEPCRLSLRHGHTFLTLEYLRGYENLIYDMHDEEPRLWDLIEMVTSFNLEFQTRLLALEPDIFGIPEDLGLQNGPLVSPRQFEKYLAPSYRRYIAPFKERDIVVHMHCDGHIMGLADQLMGLRIEVLNVQDLVNGVENLREVFGGRIAIDLDIDRQNVTVSGSPKDAANLVRHDVDVLHRPDGGLSLSYNWSPPTPTECADAVMTAMEQCGN